MIVFIVYFVEYRDDIVPKGVFEENGVKFRFLVYQKIN